MQVSRTLTAVAVAGSTIFSIVAHEAHGQDDGDKWSFEWEASIRANIRDSEDVTRALQFPPGASLRTVDPGTTAELSLININGTARYGESVKFHGSLDLIDLYDRNPTSGDNEIDVDEAWAQIGDRAERGFIPEGQNNHWFRIGKIPKFERQEDRHSVSYGLVSTAYNRFEDAGFELGADFGKRFYAVFSQTAGNPLYFRDPNALAGDNGDFSGSKNSGFPMFYDAEVDDYDFGDMETGFGIGFREGNPENTRVLDVLLYTYNRDLKDSSEITGSEYGGDLDLLSAPTADGGEQVLNGVSGNNKEEIGLSAWIYYDDMTLFGQFIQSEAAGLDRTGIELEASYHFQWNTWMEINSKPMFKHITPMIRYSEIDPDFAGPSSYPAPSLWWDWSKVDIGATVSVLPSVDLVIENSFNEFTAGGQSENVNEFLVSLTYTYRPPVKE